MMQRIINSLKEFITMLEKERAAATAEAIAQNKNKKVLPQWQAWDRELSEQVENLRRECQEKITVLTAENTQRKNELEQSIREATEVTTNHFFDAQIEREKEALKELGYEVEG